MRAAIRRHLLVFSAVLLGNLGGCATPPPASDPDAVADYKETNDPLEPTNRAIYAFNDGLDTVILQPGGAGLPLPGAGAGAHQHPQRAEQSRHAGGIGQRRIWKPSRAAPATPRCAS